MNMALLIGGLFISYIYIYIYLNLSSYGYGYLHWIVYDKGY